jgi:predicted protein tyrosine phosphatase
VYRKRWGAPPCTQFAEISARILETVIVVCHSAGSEAKGDTMILRRPAAIHVCALAHVPDVAEEIGASHLVSAINADLSPQTPASILRERHLKLDMHDITEAQPGATPPHAEHAAQLIDFVQGWDKTAPLLIHCFAGLSRSTAAAFITLCALNPRVPEEMIARALRRSSDTAVPNRLFVSHADALMRREGRMLSALSSMGRNKPAIECVPFSVLCDHNPLQNQGRAA